MLDEPTASPDPDTGDRIRTYLEAYRDARRATILLASHNMAEVERLCSRVMMMRAGRIVDQGSPAELIRRYGRANLEDVFLDIARNRQRADQHPDRHPDRKGPEQKAPNKKARTKRQGGMSGPAAGAGTRGAFATWRRIRAMILRYVYLYRGSWPRVLEMAYWPTLQMIMWGFLTIFLASKSGFFVQAAGVLIAAVLLWDVLFRASLGVSLSFLEEMWSRNLGHLFVSPLRPASSSPR